MMPFIKKIPLGIIKLKKQPTWLPVECSMFQSCKTVLRKICVLSYTEFLFMHLKYHYFSIHLAACKYVIII